MPYYAVQCGNVLKCVQADTAVDAAAAGLHQFATTEDNVMYPDAFVLVSEFNHGESIIAVEEALSRAGLKRVEVVKQTSHILAQNDIKFDRSEEHED